MQCRRRAARLIIYIRSLAPLGLLKKFQSAYVVAPPSLYGIKSRTRFIVECYEAVVSLPQRLITIWSQD